MAARQLSLTEAERTIGEELADWGKVALLETTGRISGMPVRNAVGFIEGDDASLTIAAGNDESDWALNLRAHPTCRATVGERVRAYQAEEVGGPDRSSALRDLILKYGTPAERLGHGPVFRLSERADVP